MYSPDIFFTAVRNCLQVLNINPRTRRYIWRCIIFDCGESIATFIANIIFLLSPTMVSNMIKNVLIGMDTCERLSGFVPVTIRRDQVQVRQSKFCLPR